MRACERVASTVNLTESRPVPLSTAIEESHRTSQILSALRRRRSGGRRRLSDARTPTSRAREANRLQAAYRDARQALEKLARKPPSSEAQMRLPVAVKPVESSYRVLGRAATSRSRSRYNAARGGVIRTESALIKLL